ncbi:hypothetical protein CSP48_003995, partial [Salmonella enterica subsp. arizonae]|nr:hypothetical protein [Salmonella enterica subsp. arizonae]
MDSQGYITGYDTKWREQLTLIRSGATIFFITPPFQAAVITEVISDTSMRAIATGGAIVDRGDYIILLHDSLTVDGLAQDVAETLRYYQGEETQIEGFIEFLKDFDWKRLEDLHAETVNKANEAATSAQNAEASNQASQNAMNNAQQAKTDAESARDIANTAEQGAINARTGSETARDEARQWAQQVNPENLLHKDQNLNDLSNTEVAKTNLKVNGFETLASESRMYWPKDKTRYVYLNHSGVWGCYDTDPQIGFVPLRIEQGGTSANNNKSARLNLNTPTAGTFIPDNVDVFQYILEQGETGLYFGGSALINAPLPTGQGGWWDFTFTVHGRLDDKAYYGTLTGICADNRIFIAVLNEGKFPGGWLEVYRQNGEATYNSVSARSGQFFGVRTTRAGGSADMYLWNHPTENATPYTSVNGLRGNFYDSYWEFYGVRGGSANIDSADLHIDNGSSNYKFSFATPYKGYLAAPKGFKGVTDLGGWGYEGDYMGPVFFTDVLNVGSNSALWSPLVGGGYMHEGGYRLQYALGAVGNGSQSWPDVSIKLLGDNTYHRSFQFRYNGDFFTWGSSG